MTNQDAWVAVDMLSDEGSMDWALDVLSNADLTEEMGFKAAMCAGPHWCGPAKTRLAKILSVGCGIPFSVLKKLIGDMRAAQTALEEMDNGQEA